MLLLNRSSLLFIQISPLHKKYLKPLIYSSKTVLFRSQKIAFCITKELILPPLWPFTPSHEVKDLHNPYYRGCCTNLACALLKNTFIIFNLS